MRDECTKGEVGGVGEAVPGEEGGDPELPGFGGDVVVGKPCARGGEDAVEGGVVVAFESGGEGGGVGFVEGDNGAGLGVDGRHVGGGEVGGDFGAFGFFVRRCVGESTGDGRGGRVVFFPPGVGAPAEEERR